MFPLRIVSLLPSATEILHALGLGQFQIGRSHECDCPASASSLPVCSRPNIAVDGSSADIDRLVKQRLSNALSIYDVNADLLAALQPTHILTQTQCQVCAVSLNDVEAALHRTTGTQARVISLEPHRLADLWSDIRTIGQSCGADAAGAMLVDELQARMQSIEHRVQEVTDPPTVAAVEWLEPVMTAGNWIPELIERAGGRPLFGTPGEHSPYRDWSEIAAADPDILLLLPCGFDIPRTRSELHWLTGRPGWTNLRAVRTGRTYLCDGNQFFNRPGPRLVESLQALAEIIHPELFDPALRGLAWEPLNTNQSTSAVMTSLTDERTA